MCIGADLNQDHFSQLLAARPRQAFFSIIHAKPWTLLFLSAPSFVFLSWPPKKKSSFFSLSLWMEWEDHHWEESRKHRNIRQSAAPPPKLINLLSSRFWLWREHISAAFTTTGGTSMLKGRELFHSIREGISHSSSRTLQLPPSSKEKQVMGWKSTGRRTKLFFQLIRNSGLMNVLLGFAYKLTISRNSESPSQKHSGWKPKEMSHHFKLLRIL